MKNRLYLVGRIGFGHLSWKNSAGIFYKSVENKIEAEWRIFLEMIVTAWRTAGAIVGSPPLDIQRMWMHRKVADRYEKGT